MVRIIIPYVRINYNVGIIYCAIATAKRYRAQADPFYQVSHPVNPRIPVAAGNTQNLSCLFKLGVTDIFITVKVTVRNQHNPHVSAVLD